MILIHLDHRKHLRFSAQGKVFQSTCLPFELSLAQWVFIKTHKPIVALVRELGREVGFYIDNILLMAKTKDQAPDQMAGRTFILENLGFTLTEKKVVLEPTQRLDFMGFTVDTVSKELCLLGDKLKKIHTKV